MKKMNSFKKILMASLAAGVLLTSVAGYAGGGRDYSGIAGAAVSSIIVAVAALLTKPTLYEPSWAGGFVPVINVDAAQVALEVMMLNQMKNTKAEWDPEPEKEYQQAAQQNGGGSGGGGGVSLEELTQPLNFQVASLENVGIEAIKVGSSLSEIATDGTRSAILEQLMLLKVNDASASSGSTDKAGKMEKAGSCSAPYSVCLAKDPDEMKDSDKAEVKTKQEQNEQFFATAGITHAELGLRSVQQAMVDDGVAENLSAMAKEKESKKGKTTSSSNNSNTDQVTVASVDEVNALLASGQSVSVANLSAVIGTGQNTASAQKIVALMNLELAQRLNQGNMLQGSSLTLEAASAMKSTSKIME